MKRFWTAVAVTPERGIALDGKPVRTPVRTPLILPNDAVAQAVAAEWQGVGETLDPRVMPLTGLANAAVDRIAPDPRAFAAGLARYGGSDLLCYRAESPDALIARQRAAWDPVIAWAQTRYDVRIVFTAGIVPVVQPPATLARLGDAIAALTPFALAAASPIVTITGSLLLFLALYEGELSPDQAWTTAMIDEAWQAEQWGDDPLAIDARAARRSVFDAATEMLTLLTR